MTENSLSQRLSGSLRNSVTFKMFVIGFLILIMLIPTSMVNSLIWDRKGTKNDAVREISSKWGARQILIGPVLTIPYKSFFTKKDGTRDYHVKSAHFLPKMFQGEGSVQPEIRYRGIYKAVLYTTDIQFKGQFQRPDFAALNIADKNVLWSRAYFSIGIKDMRGIRSDLALELNGQSVQMGPGVKQAQFLESGVSAKIPARVNIEDKGIHYSFRIHLNGSQQLEITPVGEVTEVSLHSPWQTPSFIGAFLPKQREVSDKGFAAQWRVLHLNRNFPQQWVGTQKDMDESAFGVKLFIAADIYQQVTRTSKYAILFILLTFTAFFFTEITGRKRLHPIQYLLIGFAMVIFYSLLIAISEHVKFGFAYLLASVAVIGLIGLYTQWALKRNVVSALIVGILTILYGYLYMILQLEDYALLAGSIGLFVALASVMFITRRIDWYSVSMGDEKTENDT